MILNSLVKMCNLLGVWWWWLPITDVAMCSHAFLWFRTSEYVALNSLEIDLNFVWHIISHTQIFDTNKQYRISLTYFNFTKWVLQFSHYIWIKLKFNLKWKYSLYFSTICYQCLDGKVLYNHRTKSILFEWGIAEGSMQTHIESDLINTTWQQIGFFCELAMLKCMFCNNTWFSL